MHHSSIQQRNTMLCPEFVLETCTFDRRSISVLMVTLVANIVRLDEELGEHDLSEHDSRMIIKASSNSLYMCLLRHNVTDICYENEYKFIKLMCEQKRDS